ncbi:MAG: hypothetical protein ACRDWG_00355, partial [Actinomycetes bacterium]
LWCRHDLHRLNDREPWPPRVAGEPVSKPTGASSPSNACSQRHASREIAAEAEAEQWLRRAADAGVDVGLDAFESPAQDET